MICRLFQARPFFSAQPKKHSKSFFSSEAKKYIFLVLSFFLFKQNAALNLRLVGRRKLLQQKTFPAKIFVSILSPMVATKIFAKIAFSFFFDSKKNLSVDENFKKAIRTSALSNKMKSCLSVKAQLKLRKQRLIQARKCIIFY